MPKVTVIPPSINRATRQDISAPTRRKVAAYARVSTDFEEQLTSYEAQISYYTNYIQRNPDWEFVKIYTDEGISATSTKHREGFNSMIADALDGKIDLIITKSVSRFARNTVDSLTTIRKLKEHHVECFFEKENIWTFDSKGELLITIMSSLAQEESRSISENVTWGQRKRFADGKVSLPYAHFLGYRKGENGLPEIVPEEAEIVRYIYQRFIDGLTPYKIANELTAQGIPTPCGKEKWSASTVKSILTNEKYKGDALLQKKFTVDFLTKSNKSTRDKFRNTMSRTAIRQLSRQRSSILCSRNFKNAALSLTAAPAFMRPRLSAETAGVTLVRRFGIPTVNIAVCNSKFKGSHFCTTPHLYEPEIQEKFLQAFAQYFSQKDVVIKNCQFALNHLKKQESRKAELQDEFVAVNEKLKEYIQHGGENFDALNAKYEELSAQLDAEEAAEFDRKRRIAKMQKILQTLKKTDSVLETFDESVWNAVLENLTVFHDGSLVFLFRDGTEIKV